MYSTFCIVEHDLNRYLDDEGRRSWIAEQSTTLRKRCETCGQFFVQEVNDYDDSLRDESECHPCRRPNQYRWVGPKKRVLECKAGWAYVAALGGEYAIREYLRIDWRTL